MASAQARSKPAGHRLVPFIESEARPAGTTTLLLAAGVHSKVVHERLSHSQIGIRLDTYSHVVPTLQLEAASKLAMMRSS